MLLETSEVLLSEGPLVIAHRGDSLLFPENTSIAISNAIDKAVDLVEIDVQFSKDMQVMVIHDSKVDRTTNMKGPVSSFTLEELKGMDAGLFKGEEFQGTQIPTLEEVLDLFVSRKDCKTKLLIEIKFKLVSWYGLLKPYENLAERVVEIVRAKGAQGVVIIQSFLEEYLQIVRSLEPSIPVHLLVLPWRDINYLVETVDHVDAFNPHVNSVTVDFVGAVKSKNKQIYVWTVDDEEQMNFCIDVGVHGIITNRPGHLRQFLEDKKQTKKDQEKNLINPNPEPIFAGFNLSFPFLISFLRFISGRY